MFFFNEKENSIFNESIDIIIGNGLVNILKSLNKKNPTSM